MSAIYQKEEEKGKKNFLASCRDPRQIQDFESADTNLDCAIAQSDPGQRVHIPALPLRYSLNTTRSLHEDRVISPGCQEFTIARHHRGLAGALHNLEFYLAGD
jgi:hypothetical protein